ncbi:MAG: ComEA family DNA-binding protein [Eubacterium sp.]|nr:ComEA family DNA-binding protein [Eubacterium sp.]
MKYKKNIIFMILVGICICGCLWLYGENEPETTENVDVTKEQAGQLEQTEQDMEQIYVHIVGAVKKPGVYIFQHKPRVIEVVDKAGGFTKDAVVSMINQAEVVEDGTQLTIASSKDNKKKEKSQNKGTDANSGKVNLNQASKEELMTLTGIGEAKAVAIIAYREANGRFQKIEDLMNITGIKEGVFDKIQSQICV